MQTQSSNKISYHVRKRSKHERSIHSRLTYIRQPFQHKFSLVKKKKKQTKQERQKESLLAKRNELSGKCFSNTSLRPESMSKNGYVTRVNRCFLCCQPLPERPFAPDSNKETVFITVTLRHFTSNLELWLDLVTFEAQSHHKHNF